MTTAVCIECRCSAGVLGLRGPHWLRVPERIKFRLRVLTFRCLKVYGTVPRYIAEILQLTTSRSSRSHPRSADTSTLIVPATRRRSLMEIARFHAVACQEHSAVLSMKCTVTGGLSTAAEDSTVHCSGHPSARMPTPEPRHGQHVTVYCLSGGPATFT